MAVLCFCVAGLLIGILDLIEGYPVVLKNLIGEQMHPLGEILVKNEAKDVIAKVIRAHLTPQGVGNVPELGF
jgi:hypothetical protein